MTDGSRYVEIWGRAAQAEGQQVCSPEVGGSGKPRGAGVQKVRFETRSWERSFWTF